MGATMPLLPIFPLGSVLIPGSTLPLHIFEERYKLMINECVEADLAFGVVLIRSGPEVGGAAEPFEIGTTARIARVERLEFGRMNILTVGAERFRILSADRSRPFLQAEVEYIPRNPGGPGEADADAEMVRALFSEYYRLNLQLGDQWTRHVGVPSKPAILADFVAGRLDVDLATRQKLLEADAVRGCLEMERAILDEAIGALGVRVNAQQRRKYGGFGALN
jgi:Lon protease-like protein